MSRNIASERRAREEVERIRGTRDAHRANRKRNTLSPRGKSPEALRATVQVAAHVRRPISGTTRPEGCHQGHSPRPFGAGGELAALKGSLATGSLTRSTPPCGTVWRLRTQRLRRPWWKLGVG